MIVLQEKLYTSEETADVLGVTSRTLYRYVKNGDIEPETKTKSGTFRFTRTQIYKYLYPNKYEKIISLLLQKESQQSSGGKLSYLDNSLLDKFKTVEKIDDSIKNEPSVLQSDRLNEDKNILKEDINKTPTYVPKSPSQNADSTPPMDSTGVLDNEKTDTNRVVEDKSVEADFNNAVKSLEESMNKNTSKNEDRPDSRNNTRVYPAKEEPIVNASKPSLVPTEEPIHDSQMGETFTNVKEIPPVNEPILNEDNQKQDVVSNMPTKSAVPNKVPPVMPEEQENWNYYTNEGKDILDLARELNSLGSETGRQYAATMYGGLSLHHDIDEFNMVHFYVEPEDINWWVEQLELSKADQTSSNICLITSSDTSIFENAYKLRGLYVVEDQRLIQDLMKHGEKDLARTLL